MGVGLVATTGLLAAGSAAAFADTNSPAHNSPAHNSTVYTETNQVAGNTVLAYRANADGGLTPIGSYTTGGTGTGTSPGSQGGVTLADNGRLLAVVNGGSNSVSVFAVDPLGRLHLVETTSSGGIDPISVTAHGLWVYALNKGDATTPANIAGFNLLGGALFNHPVGGQALNAAASSPEDIAYTPDGRHLVVTEKASSTVDVFPVNAFGLAGPAVTTTLPGAVGPYGLTFTANGDAAVTEAATNALATFSINPQGQLTPISVVGDGQQAPCWVVLTPNGQEAFVTNAHNGTVSAYEVAADGTLTLLDPAVQASPGAGDTDVAIAGASTLYISDQPNFDASAISPTGTLSPSAPVVSGLPAGTFGLAATTGHGFGLGLGGGLGLDLGLGH